MILRALNSELPIAWLIVGERFSDKGETIDFEKQLRNVAAGPLAGKLFFLGPRDDVARTLSELTLSVHL